MDRNQECLNWLVVGGMADLFMLDAMDLMRDVITRMPRIAYDEGVRDYETLDWLEDFRSRHLELLQPIHKATWLFDYKQPMDLDVSSWGN
jgi:hypothetical protein